MLLATGVFLVMAVMIHSAVNRHFYEQDLHALQGKLELICQTLNTEALPLSTLNNALIGHHELVLRIDTPQHAFFKAGHQTVPNAAMSITSLGLKQLNTWQQANTHYRGLGMVLDTPYHRYMIVIGTDISHHQLFLQRFKQQLIGVGAIGLALITLLGWLAVRHGLRPLSRLTSLVESISAQQLHQRLQPHAMPVELQALAHAFNAMLTRLADSMSRLSDFSSDLAHELRTPINNLLTQTQVSLAKTRSISDYQEVLYSNLEEYERLARMIADMLFLAKADNGLMLPQKQRLDLVHECQMVVEFYEALAADKQLQLSLQGEAIIDGDAVMIRRAISNILTNAIRHTPPQGQIAMILVSEASRCVLHLDNTGSAIAPEHLPRLFDRFYRADASRQRCDEGAGLGLAITKSIIEAHQGYIEVSSDAHKTRFSLYFKAAERDASTAKK